MSTRLLQVIWPGALAFSMLPGHAGGWAVVTVQDLPDYVVAGQPVTFTYTVRQHGVELISGLNGRLEARSRSSSVKPASATGLGRGEYRATVTVPSAGDWTFTIHSGFGPSNVTLSPITAIDAGGMLARPLTNRERGARLFVAKGCITCHVHSAVKSKPIDDFAPDLTHKRFEAEYLKRYLADPSIIAQRTSTVRMPNLNLKASEIEALTAFINNSQADK